MKKVACLLAVLIITAVAPAATVDITVNGTVPTEPFVVGPSDILSIGLEGFVAASSGESLTGFIIVQGLGSITGGSILQGDGGICEFVPGYEFSPGMTWSDFMADYGYIGVRPNILMFELYDSAPPFTDMSGMLIDGITFHCDGDEPALISCIVYNEDFTQLIAIATQEILQVPEPITAVLLGLGGLLLRRRK